MSGEQYYYCDWCGNSWFMDPFEYDDYEGKCMECGLISCLGDPGEKYLNELKELYKNRNKQNETSRE